MYARTVVHNTQEAEAEDCKFKATLGCISPDPISNKQMSQVYAGSE